MPEFQLCSDFAPTGDQPQAIEALVAEPWGLHRLMASAGRVGRTRW